MCEYNDHLSAGAGGSKSFSEPWLAVFLVMCEIVLKRDFDSGKMETYELIQEADP